MEDSSWFDRFIFKVNYEDQKTIHVSNDPLSKLWPNGMGLEDGSIEFEFLLMYMERQTYLTVMSMVCAVLCCAMLVFELVLLFKLCRYMFATFVMLVLSRILLLVVFFIVNLVSLSIKICIAFAIHDALPLFKMSWFCSKLLRYAHLINKLVDMNELISEGAKNG